MYRLDSLMEMKREVSEEIFRVNLLSDFLVNRTFLPTSELAPLDLLSFTGIYAVTKGDKYAYSLAMELQLLGISVETGMLGVSTRELDRFCEKTKLYPCNVRRFHRIVDRVEARSILPEKIGKKALEILRKKHPAFAYGINRNPLLRILDLCPKRLQLFAIRQVLKQEK